MVVRWRLLIIHTHHTTTKLIELAKNTFHSNVENELEKFTDVFKEREHHHPPPLHCSVQHLKSSFISSILCTNLIHLIHTTESYKPGPRILSEGSFYSRANLFPNSTTYWLRQRPFGQWPTHVYGKRIELNSECFLHTSRQLINALNISLSTWSLFCYYQTWRNY